MELLRRGDRSMFFTRGDLLSNWREVLGTGMLKDSRPRDDESMMERSMRAT